MTQACAVDPGGDAGADPTRRFGGVLRLIGADGVRPPVGGARGGGRHRRRRLLGGRGAGAFRGRSADADRHGPRRRVEHQPAGRRRSRRRWAPARAKSWRAGSPASRPACRVDLVDDFVTPDNAGALIPGGAIVIDAIDQPRAKAAMIALCRRRGQPLVVCGGAGARRRSARPAARRPVVDTRRSAAGVGARAAAPRARLPARQGAQVRRDGLVVRGAQAAGVSRGAGGRSRGRRGRRAGSAAGLCRLWFTGDGDRVARHGGGGGRDRLGAGRVTGRRRAGNWRTG